MTIGSSIEIIWHFAGYLHLTQDYVASRVRHDEIFYDQHQADYTISSGDVLARATSPGDMTSVAIRVKYSPGPEDHAQPEWTDLPGYDALVISASPVNNHASLPFSFGYGPGGDTFSLSQSFVVQTVPETHAPTPFIPQTPEVAPPTYAIQYVDGGDDTLANLSQANVGNDRDYVSDGSSEVGPLAHVTVDESMQDMLAVAKDYAPATALPAGESIEFWTNAVLDRHESLAASETEAQPLAPGRYVNGELIPTGNETGARSEGNVQPEGPEAPVREAGCEDPAQVAVTGGNELVNAGTILDVNEAPATLVVVGNYYETNAILQTNILQNKDVVFHEGAAPDILDTSGSTLDNVANFVVEEVGRQYGFNSSAKVNLRIDIDYVDGDAMDIKSLTQRNYYDDGDVTVQTRFDSYSEIHTGDNAQLNVARFADWGTQYDIIIVRGDYHSANIISQTNVILDNDLIGWSSHADANDSVFSGQNALLNDATIARYGASGFGDIDRKMESLIDDLHHRDDLNHNAWSDFYGASSGQLNVLFVSGNYYDLNIISQINVLADADLAIQMGSSGLQWISTGGNSAVNQAVIANAGGVYEQYIGGHSYEDSILVQANLMADASQTVATDPGALVSELVAFMDHTPNLDDTDVVAWTKGTFGHGDTFGSVLT